MMEEDPNIGRVVANRYKLTDLVGKGAMGRVYRAEDVLLGSVIAVKFLAHTLLNRKMRDRFKIEARTCAQLGQRSIHIVRVTDYGVNEDDIPFYVMEYLKGESLSEIINTQPLPLPRFLSITRQVCLGLQCAHEGILIDNRSSPIIHRDIKPSNILVSQDASLGELAKILDFGIAKLIQEDGGQTNSFMGTLAYSSPEQMEGRELDARSDIYSLGVMMFEMLTGKMPLQAETHTFGAWYRAHHTQPPRAFEVVSPSLKLPKPLENLVLRCLAKSANDRPQSIADILRELEPYEQRYSAGRHISHRISEVLERSTPIGRPSMPSATSRQPSIGDEVVQNSVWPKDKPVAEIVFTQILETSTGEIPTLWHMLPQAEIQSFQINRLYNRIYKNFLCSMSPHPALLWITAIYNSLHEPRRKPRFLPAYCDLKDLAGQRLVHLLSEKGQYKILLFAKEEPVHCAHAITVTINPSQRSQLQQWVVLSRSAMAVGQFNLSKNMLKQELDKLKPKIIEDMERTPNDSSLGGLMGYDTSN